MRIFSREYLREVYYYGLYVLSHPLAFTIVFLFPYYKFNDFRRLMVVHIVYGLKDYKLYALLGTFGLMIVIISYFLFDRMVSKEESILNLTGAICIVVAYKIVKMDDNSNYMTREIYNGIIASAFAICSALFILYNLIPWMKWNVKQFVEDIWAEKDEERNRLN